MVTDFSSPIKGQNNDSCARLVNYLEKENSDKKVIDKEHFFSKDKQEVNRFEVIEMIDKNGEKQGLKKDQDRFYTFVLSPSERELEHISNDSDKLKAFTREAMENYAKNFNRGIECKDLVWYAKVEQNRHYTHLDKEVVEGLKQKGEKKEGLQTHIHIIVSRFSAREQENERTMSLSPLTNQKGGAGFVKGGFERTSLIEANERSFDKMFNYHRSLDESFKYANTMKNGSKEEKLEITKGLMVKEVDKEIKSLKGIDEEKKLNISDKIEPKKEYNKEEEKELKNDVDRSRGLSM